MNKQIYKEFMGTLPVACSLQRLIHDDDNQPIDLSFEAINDAFTNLFHMPKEDIIKKYMRQLNIIDQITLTQLLAKSNEAIRNHLLFALPIHHIPSNQWYGIYILPLKDDYFLLLFNKILEKNFNLLQMEHFLQANLDIMCVSSLDGIFLKVNKEFEQVLGYSRNELEGKSFLPLIHPKDRKASMEAMAALNKKEAVNQFVNRYRRKDGSYVYIEWKVHPYGPYIYSSGRDITEAKMLQAELTSKNKQLAKLTQSLKEANNILFDKSITDSMTGLKNRRYFEEYIIKEMQFAESEGLPLCLLIYDIDFFKEVNDTYGHTVGDDVLKFYTGLANNFARKKDIAFRMGGEEFALLMPDTCINEARQLAEDMRLAFEKTPHPIVGQVTASFGVAQMHKGESILEWYQRIDKALYTAKTHGRNKVVAVDEHLSYTPRIELQWKEKWTSGNQIVDEDHKELIKLILDSFQMSYEEDKTIELHVSITNLIEHIINHFDREEKILEAVNYKDLENHKALHARLVNAILQLQEDFNRNELRPFIFLSFILDHIILNHLDLDDRKYFDYLM